MYVCHTKWALHESEKKGAAVALPAGQTWELSKKWRGNLRICPLSLSRTFQRNVKGKLGISRGTCPFSKRAYFSWWAHLLFWKLSSWAHPKFPIDPCFSPFLFLFSLILTEHQPRGVVGRACTCLVWPDTSVRAVAGVPGTVRYG